MHTSLRIKKFQRSYFQSSDKFTRKKIITEFKAEKNVQNNIQLFRYLESTPIGSATLGILFPRNLNNLYALNYASFDTGDLDAELIWIISYLVTKITEITGCLAISNTFANSFLNGDYDSCKAALEKYKTDFGYAFWLIEKQLLVEEQGNGLEASTKLYKENVRPFIKEPMAAAIAYYLSIKAERRTSLPSLETRIYNTWKNATDADFARSYLSFHILHYRKLNIHNLSGAIGLSMGVPLFDRFRLLKRALNSITSADISVTTIQLLQDFSLIINDEELTILTDRLKSSTEVPVWLSARIAFSDLYFEGQYAELIALGKEKIFSSIISLDEIMLVARSAFYLGQALSSLNIKPSIVGELLYAFYLQATRTKAAEYVPILERVLQVSSDTSICSDLSSLIIHERRMSVIATDTNESENYRSLVVLSHKFKGTLTGTRIVEKFNHSDAIRFFFIPNSIEQEMVFSKIPFHRSLRWKAKLLSDAAGIERSVSCLNEAINELMGKFAGPIASVRSILREIVMISLSQKVFQLPLRLVMDIYIKYKILPDVLTISNLIKAFDEEHVNPVLGDIDFALLQFAGNASIKQQYHAYEAYLTKQSVLTPRQLIAMPTFILGDREQLFLRNICSKDVLSESVEFSSTDDLETERLTICDHIKNFPGEGSAEIHQEIKTLTDSIAIRRGLKKVAETKIFADESGLRISRGEFYRDLFLRYKDSVAFDKLGLIPVSADEILPAGIDSEGLKKTKMYVLREPGFNAFQEIFLTIRDDFTLSNEFGLDSYLSVRIRHGVLLGQLRKPFEIYHLITKRTSAASKYTVNEFWEAKFSPDENRSFLQPQLEKLSSEVDSLITQINNVWLRISTEKNIKPESRLDYSYSELILTRIFKRFEAVAKTDNEMIDFIFAVLWQQTDENIKKIREELEDAVLNSLLNSIKDTQGLVKKFLSSSESSTALLHALTKCGTDLQNDLTKISSWFRLPTEDSEGAFGLQLAATIAFQLIKDLNPKTNVSLELDVIDGPLISNRHFTTFVDIFLLVFSNAVKHSGLADKAFSIGVNGTLTKEIIDFTINNSLHGSIIPQVAIRTVQTRWKNVEQDLTNDTVRTEGGSGFYKLHNLLKYNLLCDQPQVAFTINQQNEFCVRILLANAFSL